MYKVLIIEDDPMVAMINGEYVKQNKNFTVAQTFRNGQDALTYLQTNTVDLIVLDVFMPYMDGIETLKRIRQMKISTEVIMVTAANDAATLEATMHLGVMDYLVKPFAYERFQVALEKFSTKVQALKQNQTFDQKTIDALLQTGPQSSDPSLSKKYPKGIQEKTLTLIMDFFTQNPTWHTGDLVAEKTGLSSVTIRHYMSYLVSQHQLQESINYETGGRPSMLYKIRT